MRFHATYKDLVHAHPDLMCDLLGFAPDAFDEEPPTRDTSPWTQGGCGLLAHATAVWMGKRASWQMVAKYEPRRLFKIKREAHDFYYPHALVVYRSANPAVGTIYMDAVEITTRLESVLRAWKATDLLTRTHVSNAPMRENYGYYPWDERHVELIRQVLITRFGRWPKG
jgi:hypothetical protein